MIVCSCFGTTDREIRDAFGPGGSHDCPAGQGCGNCMTAVEKLADEARDDSPDAPRADGASRAQDS